MSSRAPPCEDELLNSERQPQEARGLCQGWGKQWSVRPFPGGLQVLYPVLLAGPTSGFLLTQSPPQPSGARVMGLAQGHAELSWKPGPPDAKTWDAIMVPGCFLTIAVTTQ